MINEKSPEYRQNHPALEPIDIDIYKEFSDGVVIDGLKEMAAPIQEKKWINMNSTFSGGGVAEMLKSVLPFSRALGIDTEWLCLEGDEAFFTITKKFHNLLQGVPQDYQIEDILNTYLETNRKNTENTEINGDLIIIHDPQPCAVINYTDLNGPALWRCHIDTTEADQMIWNFLLPYINQYDAAVFTTPQFVKKGIRRPVYNIAPSIDPVKPKNRQYSKEEAVRILDPLFSEYQIDGDRPLILAVSRYDIHKNQKMIIQTFKELKKKPGIKKINPQLILVGNSASDDPEGMATYQIILEEIGQDPDIYALLNIKNNDENIGALMKLARFFIHLSTREGFGLVVTEAMWQGTPVIGSGIGGIKQQITDGKSGFITEPSDRKKIIESMEYLLSNPVDRDRMGRHAMESVRNHYLLPSLVRNYMHLMRYYLGIDQDDPPFMMNRKY